MRVWRAPLDPVADLLDETDVRGLLHAEPPPPAGAWTQLSKPGLRGRQRWRWIPAANSVTGKQFSPIYVKRYFWPALRDQLDRCLKQTFRHSRAWWEFQQCQALAQAAIGAPTALACAEHMTAFVERRSAVLLAAVEGEALDRLWRRACAEDWPVTRGWARHEITLRLARFVSAFHQSGRCHRDLYLCHVFATLDPMGVTAPQFHLIDLARVLMPGIRRMRWLLKDLGQLDSSAREVGATRTDRLRFLRAYLALDKGALRVRTYARRIIRRSDAILAREARKRAVR